MSRKNLCLAYRCSDEEFAKKVQQSLSCAELMRMLGFGCIGGNANVRVKKRIAELKLSTTHWRPNTMAANIASTKPHEEYFAKNTTHGGRNMRLRILKYNLLEYRCALCGNCGEWNGQELILQVDHINGDHHDNRLENLRFLCPNCHAQTDTFAGKNVKRK